MGWIKEVADYTFNQLKNWGISNGNNINLIGHSLGTFVSSELANNFVEAGFNKVSTLTALEPADTAYPKLGGLLSYDLDGQTAETQAPRRFDSVATFSRAFVGTASLAADTELARTATESILMDFGNSFSSTRKEHNDVVKVFANLINQTPNNLVNGLLSLDNLQENPQFQKDVFTKRFSTSFAGIITTEQIKSSNQDTAFAPTSFEAIRQGTTNQHVIYSNNKGSSLSIPRLRETGDSYELFGGKGNDSLFINSVGTAKLTGGTGSNEFIFGGNVSDSTSLPFAGIEIEDFKK